MHILHLTPYYAPAYPYGGVVRSVEAMTGALADRGHRITVLTTDTFSRQMRYEGPLDEEYYGLRVIRRRNVSPWLRGKLNLSTPRSMKRTAESILPSVDLLHVHEFRTLENLLVTPVAQRLHVPIVLSPHGTLNLSTGRGFLKSVWDRLLGAGVALRIDHMVALTENERAEAEALWLSFGRRETPTRFSVIPNGVNLNELSNLPNADKFRGRYGLDDAPTVLFMGRLQARKGVDVLIQAFLAAGVKHSRLLIVGPDEGMLPSLQAIAGDDARIVFTGYLEGIDRLASLAASDVFALPATGEGQSMAVLEAMAASLPVVLSPGCNMDEVAGYGAGYVVEATKAAFARKLRELLQDGELLKQMGVRARRLVEERYTWDTVAEALERVYLRLV